MLILPKKLNKNQLKNYILVSKLSEIKTDFFVIKNSHIISFQEIENYKKFGDKDILKNKIKNKEIYIL